MLKPFIQFNTKLYFIHILIFRFKKEERKSSKNNNKERKRLVVPIRFMKITKFDVKVFLLIR